MLSNNVLRTFSHILFSFSEQGKALIMPTKTLYVVMYTDNAYNLTDSFQSDVENMIIHADFNCRSRANDIAILTLSKSFKLIVKPAQISKSATATKEAGFIAGFGRLYDVNLKFILEFP